MVNIHSFTFNAFQENTYILWDETLECCIIDPGCYTKEEEDELESFIREKNLTVKLLLNTHCHIDHVLGNAFVKRTYSVPLLIHPSDENTLRSVKVYSSNYGFNNYQETEAELFLKDLEILSFGTTSLTVIFVPGHAPGHVAFLNIEENFCIGGDVLFYRSIGRTDLPGGNHNTLINSIKSRLFVLPENLIVYPGHGPETKIGDEIKFNPFLKGI